MVLLEIAQLPVFTGVTPGPLRFPSSSKRHGDHICVFFGSRLGCPHPLVRPPVRIHFFFEVFECSPFLGEECNVKSVFESVMREESLEISCLRFDGVRFTLRFVRKPDFASDFASARNCHSSKRVRPTRRNEIGRTRFYGVGRGKSLTVIIKLACFERVQPSKPGFSPKAGAC